jgi:hypothetical protein
MNRAGVAGLAAEFEVVDTNVEPTVGNEDTRDGTDEQRRFVEIALSTPDFALLEGPRAR